MFDSSLPRRVVTMLEVVRRVNRRCDIQIVQYSEITQGYYEDNSSYEFCLLNYTK